MWKWSSWPLPLWEKSSPHYNIFWYEALTIIIIIYEVEGTTAGEGDRQDAYILPICWLSLQVLHFREAELSNAFRSLSIDMFFFITLWVFKQMMWFKMNVEALIQYFHYIIIPGGPVPNPTKGKRNDYDFLNISYNFGCSSMGFWPNHMTKTDFQSSYMILLVQFISSSLIQN